MKDVEGGKKYRAIRGCTVACKSNEQILII